eukprot:CAMPEP_0204912252 /NCGR_PEP_ID=MMETSP1397-20131031/10439_1 /ASSEMBLY_ACC=CAM_ASM_000891 /TAXON_ID=49980 /ORGANISM="Climacostomum Climacostomum virens, Strain Stock W-24" /LENGTH=507 /DNA_ID=CAMNT_0052083133 /DNA_START=99 /DNA_END=1619 /DNA_ORIENTATION=-
MSFSPSVNESASRFARYPKDKALIADELLRGSLATESVYSDMPRMSQLHYNSLASYDSFLFQESSMQANRSVSPEVSRHVYESELNSLEASHDTQRTLSEMRPLQANFRTVSRNEMPEQRSPVPILTIKEEEDSDFLQTFALSSKDQNRSAILCEEKHFIDTKDSKLESIRRREDALELKIEKLFNKTKELESQLPSSRTEFQNLKNELRKKLKKYKSLAKENAEGSWTEKMLELFSESRKMTSSRRSSKRCCRHTKRTKRVSSVQTDESKVLKRDACLSPIRFHRRENSTSTASWGIARSETPESDIQPLEELPVFSSRYNSERSGSSLKQHLQSAARGTVKRYPDYYTQTEESQPPSSSSRSNVSLVTYAVTPPRPVFNAEAESSIVVDLKKRHSEYGQVASLLDTFNCTTITVKKTFTFSLQKGMQQLWLQQSSSSYCSTPEASLYFYVAPILLLNKIFSSPIGFASVYPPTSLVALTSEPTGESYEMICMACNAEKTHSKWQT